MRKRAVALILTVLVLLRGAVIEAQADASGRDVALYLDSKSADGGVELVLHLSSNEGICGLWASLCYDAEAVVLTFCGMADGDDRPLTLSYRDKEGRVDFLLDGDKNCAPDCALVSFYFSVREGAPQSFDFSLSLMDESSVLAVDGGKIRALMPDTSGCSVTICRAPTPPEYSGNALVGIYAQRANGKTEIVLSGRPAASHLALGFRLFAVDLCSAQHQTVLVVAISGGSVLDFCAELVDCRGAVCVIVTPIIYDGRSVIEGQKSSFVFW